MAVMVTHASQAIDDLVAMADAAVLGSIAIPGSGEHVRTAREFAARVLAGLVSGPGRAGRCADLAVADNVVLLTSELVTNAIRHSQSGEPGGLVMLVVLRVRGGIRVEVTDNGSPLAQPAVKDDIYTCDGHGLFLVDAVADRWGYRSAAGAGTTVWFEVGWGAG